MVTFSHQGEWVTGDFVIRGTKMRMWWSADYAIHCFFPCSTHSFYAGVADFSGVRAKFNISVPTLSQRVDETVKGTLRLAVLAPNDVAWKVDVEEFR